MHAGLHSAAPEPIVRRCESGPSLLVHLLLLSQPRNFTHPPLTLAHGSVLSVPPAPLQGPKTSMLLQTHGVGTLESSKLPGARCRESLLLFPFSPHRTGTMFDSIA